MTILGAQLDDLSRLSQRLLPQRPATSADRATAIRHHDPGGHWGAGGGAGALEQIMTHMDQLGQSVAASVAEARRRIGPAATPIGSRDRATTFQRSMQAAQNTTTDVFSQFRATIASLSDTLDSCGRPRHPVERCRAVGAADVASGGSPALEPRLGDEHRASRSADMPSASDFDAAATALTKAAAELTEWMVGTRDRFGPDTISGGALTQVCHQAVDEAEQLATSTAEALRSQAALCRQRAAAVRATRRRSAATRPR
ncbi:MAG: hypothetical protein R2710_21680 [Acidimicrobiales bacterium]